MFHSRTFRSFVVLLAVLIFASAAYAMAASNTFTNSSSKAGDGANDITGFTIDSVSYNLQVSDPTYVKEAVVTFDPAGGTPTEVSVGIDGNFATACTGPGATWTCTFTDNTVTAAAAASLRVIAAE